MSIATRLSRLAPSLTARERVVLVIRARHAGQEPDPEVLRMPKDQRREYDHLVGICIAANVALGAVLQAPSLRVLAIEQGMYPMRINLEAAAMVEADAGTGPQPASRRWRKQASVDSASFFRGVAAEQRHWLLQDALERWQELKAVETVWREVAGLFGGEDPVDPLLRDKARETEALLRRLVTELGGKHRKPPQATPEFVELVHAELDRALDYLQRRERR